MTTAWRDAVAVVTELWRYPVKSLGGERLESLAVDARGVVGDRARALHLAGGKIASGKDTRRFARVDGLLAYRARTDDDRVLIVTPDGDELDADDPATSVTLALALGVELAVRPEGAVAHLDAGPLHLVTTDELDRVRTACPGSDLDPRRFRPNVLARSVGGVDGRALTGARLIAPGGVRMAVTGRALRCPMITHAQPGLPLDRAILRAVARDQADELGAYLDVVAPGVLCVGDELRLA